MSLGFQEGDEILATHIEFFSKGENSNSQGTVLPDALQITEYAGSAVKGAGPG